MRVKSRYSPDDPSNSSFSSPATPLPDHVLENVIETVLNFITSRRDRNAVSLVCKSWYRAEAQTRSDVFIGNCYSVSPTRTVQRFTRAKSLVLKGCPRFADFNLIPTGWGAFISPWTAAMSTSYPWLEKLCFKRMTLKDDNLRTIANSFVYFKELVVICCDGFGTPGIAAIAENCRQLRVLDLVENYLEDGDEVVDWVSKFPEKTTCLESLVFDCVEFEVNFASLEALVARSPQLTRLRVNHNVTIGQLCKLMSLAPQLTHLGTGSFQSDVIAGDHDGGLDQGQLGELVSAFASSKSLVYLSGFRSIVPEYLPAIYPACANLTYLNFSYADITCEQLKPIIGNCHNLQTLWVLDSVRDEGLAAVADTCKHLQEIRVFPIDPTEDTDSPVSDVGLVAISQGCSKLRSILYFCQCMTNAAVATMSKNCPDLRVFRLCIMGRQRPDHITGEAMDDGFGAIVMNCKKLTRLAVSGLLTDKAFGYIGQFGKSVRTLSVAFAGDSDLGLRYVLEGCPKLEKLEIRDSPFGDSGLLSGIHHYYNMRFLWMSSCKLSTNSCKEVARRLPQLVVEKIRDFESNCENCDEDVEQVGKLYMYRSLAGPRTDTPPFVQIL